jgi:hypothetical protein
LIIMTTRPERFRVKALECYAAAQKETDPKTREAYLELMRNCANSPTKSSDSNTPGSIGKESRVRCERPRSPAARRKRHYAARARFLEPIVSPPE